MVGTTMLVMAGISAAAQAYGAYKSSKAAKKAGQQQSEGATQARGAIDESYKTQMGLLDPYAALGRQSANTLGRLMQPGVPYTSAMQASDAAAFQSAPSQWQAPPAAIPDGSPGMAVPRGTPAPPPAFMPFAREPVVGGGGGLPPPPPPSNIPGAQRFGTRRRLGALMPPRRY